MSIQPIERRIPVTILTGFLGAGKTTLLNHLLRQPEMADGRRADQRIRLGRRRSPSRAKLDEDVIMLDSGCICCTVRGDLTRSLTDLFMRCMRRELKPIKRVVIETTGLADPAPVIYTLMDDFFVSRALSHGRRGDRGRCDARLEGNSRQHAEPVKQVAMADRLLLTKCDLASEEHWQTIKPHPRAPQPGAAQVEVRQRRSRARRDHRLRVCTSPRQQVARRRRLAGRGKGARRTAQGERPSPPSRRRPPRRARLQLLADLRRAAAMGVFFVEADRHAAAHHAGDRILRIKGLLNVVGDYKPRVVQCVQHVNYPYTRLDDWPQEAPYNDRKSRLVFIVRDLPRSLVDTGVLDVLRRP
jgi:G3E family GTPase